MSKSQNRIVLAMSLQSHYDHLLRVKRSKKAITCLDGIRSISIFWVVLGHTVSQNYYKFSNVGEFGSKVEEGWLVAITSGLVAVDTFFLLGGLLTAYLATQSWRSALKRGPLGVIKTYILFILNRYARLTPILALNMWATQAFWPVIGNGGTYKAATIQSNVIITTNLTMLKFEI